MKLLDCPGIVFDDSDAGATLLRNCVDAEAMTDPTPAVAAVLKRCAPEQLMQVRFPLVRILCLCRFVYQKMFGLCFQRESWLR